MALSLTINGVSYAYPEQGDADWGPDATAWAQAVTNSTFPKTGGLWNLTGELNFGTNFGIKALYIKTETALPSVTGVLRLAHTDKVGWRNLANTADLPFGVSATGDTLEFNGYGLVDDNSVQTLSNKKIPFITSNTASPATAGVLRLANTDAVEWRNAAGTADLALGVSLTDNLQFNGIDLVDVSSAQTLSNKTINGLTINSVTSGTVNPATVGVVRLAKTDSMAWRNQTNTADLALTITAGNTLAFNGAEFLDKTGTVTGITGKTFDWLQLTDSTGYIRTATTYPASSGVLRLGHAEGIAWKNLTATGDLTLKPSATTNALQFQAIDLCDISTSQTLTNKTLTSPSIATPSITGMTPMTLPYVAATGVVTWNPVLASRVLVTGPAGQPTGLTHLSIALGGTNNPSLSVTANKMVYADGTKLVSTAAPTTTNQVMQFNGTNPDFGKILANNVHITATTAPSTPVEGDLWYAQDTKVWKTWNGTAWILVSSSLALDDLTDVNAPTPSNGQLLAWDSTTSKWIPSSGSGVTWGTITGTLSLQTDLNSALSGKQASSADLSAIDALVGTSGFLTKTATDTWALDTSTYSTTAHTHSGVYQPADADLTAIAALAGSAGHLIKTNFDTWALDTATYQVADADLTAIAALAGAAGILTKTALDTWTLDTNTYSVSTHNHSGVYQPADTDLTNIAALTGTAGFLKTDGATVWSVDANTYSTTTHNHSGVYQAVDADLTAIAALVGTSGILTKTATDTWALDTNTYSTTAHTHAGVYQPVDADLTAIAALTPTKGNIMVGNGTAWVSVGVGTNTQVLTADSVEASGVKWAAGGGAELNKLTGVNTQVADYTLALTDENKLVKMNVASANNLTVPPNSTVAFPLYCVIHVNQYGAGQTSIVGGAGVTVRTAETLKIKTQYATVSLVKIDTDEWLLSGYLEAV